MSLYPLSNSNWTREGYQTNDLNTDFIIIPIIFYIVVAAARLNLTSLRHNGWLFDMETSDEPWYHFYTFYGTSNNHLGRIMEALDLSRSL